MTVHVMMMTCVFSRGFPGVSPVNQNWRWLSSRVKFTEVSVRRPDRQRYFFSSETLGEVKFFLPVTDTEQKCDKESVGWAVGRVLLHWQLWYFQLAKDSYSYYVTLVWFCNVVLWGSVQLTDHQIDTPSTILYLWYYQTSIIYISYWNVT